MKEKREKEGQHWFWTPVMSQQNGFISILLATFIVNLFALAVPIYTLNVYDYVIPTLSRDTLLVLTFGVVIALFFDFVIKNIRAHIIDKIGLRLEAHFDLNLVDHILGGISADNQMSLGEKTNLFRELQGVREYYTSRMVTAIIDLPFILLFILIIYFISPALAAVPCVAIVIIFIANYLAQIPYASLNKQHYEAFKNKTVMLMELMRGADTVLESRARFYFLNGWSSSLDKSFTTTKKSQFWSSALMNFSVFISQITTVGILFVGVGEMAQQALTIGGLVAATILTGRIISPAINLSGLVSKLRHTQNVLKSVEDMFETRLLSDETAEFHALHDPKGSIKIQSVSYRYDENLPAILDTIDLNIRANQKIALIGPSGAGKSTLLKIMARKIRPSSGFISIDDHVYDQVSYDSLAASIGYISQNPFIFNSTVKENILMGAEISPARLKEIVMDSGLATYMGTPHFHLDKQAGENGAHLSDGQIRAIAIARMLVRDPKVILLDEPNNSMDQAQEQMFRRALSEKFKDKTVVIITHKINLLPMMDYVYLLNEGKIANHGKPHDILNALRYQGGTPNAE